MIYKEIGIDAFRDAFMDCSYQDNFSYEGLEELYNYYDNVDTDFNLDIVEIASMWKESTHAEIFECYKLEIEENKELEEVVLEYLNYNSYCIDLHNGAVLYQIF